MPIQFGGPGVNPGAFSSQPALIALAACQVWPIPSGRWAMKPGKYTSVQEYDPITGFWRTIGGGDVEGPNRVVFSDGVNYRLANQTGGTVGALLTNAGSSYTSAPTVTASAGGSVWRAIVGGAVNTAVTVSAGGSGYTYPPIVTIAPPPAGGIQATGYASLSSNAVSSITITDQGAGYSSAPTITLTNDPREGVNGVAAGSGAQAIATLTGSGTITGLICLDHGSAVTSVPTLSFSGGGGSSAAATAIMCWTITSYTAGTAGAGLSGSNAIVTALDAFPTTAAAYTNPSTQSGLVKVRNATIKAPISSGGITATGAIYQSGSYDSGIYTSAVTPLVIATASVVSTAPVLTAAMGGISDTSLIYAT